MTERRSVLPGIWENWKDPASGDWIRTFAIMRSCSIPRFTSWLRETGLRGWACKTRTQKCRHKLSLCKSAQISGDPAEFWPQRLLAFELRRWGNAARASCCRDLQQALCAEVAIERHRKARIGRGFCRSKDAPPAA